MSDKPFSSLHLYGADAPESAYALNWSDATTLRETLLREIATLERQREQLEQVDGKMNFCLQQTCREMIHSRQNLFRRLGR